MSDISITQNFLNKFDEVSNHLGLAENSSLARKAIANILDFANTHLENSKLLMPFFADHGPVHIVSLADNFSKLLNNIERLDSFNDSSIKRMDFLVVLFSSFILHDLGMAKLPLDIVENIDTLDEFWIGAIKNEFRNYHDTHSLIIIEEEIIPNYRDSIAEDCKLNSWREYWKEGHGDGWTDDPGLAMLMVTARVCQAHGDDAENFLILDSLNIYRQKSNDTLPNGTDVYKFSDQFRKKVFDESIEPILGIASAILSLCDLSDVGSHRFNIINSELTKFMLPSEKKAMQMSMFHMIGNRVGSVEFKNNKAIYLIKRAYQNKNNSMRMLSCILEGPGAALYKWGENSQLKELLHKGGLNYQGVSVEFADVQNGKWNEISTWIDRLDHKKHWYFPNVNQGLSNCEDAIDYLLVEPHWVNQLVRTIMSKDLPEKLTGEYRYFNFMLKVRKMGLLVDECFDLKSRLDVSDKRIYAVKYEINDGEYDDFISSDLLLAAIKAGSSILRTVLEELIKVENLDEKNDIFNGDRYEFRLALKKNEIHSDLRNLMLEKYDNNIILVFLSEYAEIDRYYDKLISSSKANEGPYILFFGKPSFVKKIIDRGVKEIAIDLNSEKIDFLKSQAKEVAYELGYVDFSNDEFKENLSIDVLVNNINSDFDIEFNVSKNSVEWLNQLLRMPNFYNRVKRTKDVTILSSDVKQMVKKTSYYQDDSYSELDYERQISIKLLNRKLLEEVYSVKCPIFFRNYEVDASVFRESPTHILYRLYQDRHGAKAFYETVSSLITDHENSNSIEKGYSVIILLTIVELMGLNSHGVRLNDLKNEYEIIASHFIGPAGVAGNFEDALSITHSVVPGLVNSDIDNVAFNKDAFDYSAALLDFSKNRQEIMIVLLMCLYRLHSTGKTYNVNSRLFEKKLPIKITTEFCKFIFNQEIKINERIAIAFGSVERIGVSPELYADAVKSLFQQSLKFCKINLWRINEAIVFQMAFRMFRVALKHNGLKRELSQLLDIMPFDNGIIKLGLLEAIANSDKRENKGDAIYLNSIASDITAFFLDEAIKTNGRSYCWMMAYDITYLFGKKNRKLKLLKKEYLRVESLYGASQICGFIHDGSGSAEEIINKYKDIAMKWAKMRKIFYEVIISTPNDVAARDIIPQGKVRRVKELLNVKV